MDILNAELIPVEDRVYRLIPIRDSLKNIEEEYKPMRIPLDEEDEPDYDPDLNIIHQGDKFYTTFYIPQQLVGGLIGHLGQTRRMLEERSGAKINISGGRQNESITISGSSTMVVANCYRMVMDRVTTFRLKKESTHFISFPVNSPKIQESFLRFKEEILEKYRGVRGIDQSIFQKPGKLHITVVPLVLLDERDNQNAIAILTKCMDNILKDFSGKRFEVRVKGVECMNDDPTEVDVLYAKVEELDGDNRLQIISDNIMKEFCDASLARKQFEKDNVKIHITIMNTLFRAKLENTDTDDKETSQRETFDARRILKDYKDYDFGQTVLNEVHISIRYTEASDGFYKSVQKVKLNV